MAAQPIGLARLVGKGPSFGSEIFWKYLFSVAKLYPGSVRVVERTRSLLCPLDDWIVVGGDWLLKQPLTFSLPVIMSAPTVYSV